MKKIRAICVILWILCFLFLSSMPAAAAQLPQAGGDSANQSVTNGCNTLDGQLPLLGTEQLVQNAEAVVLYEWSSKTLLYAWNADETMYPASLVKIMTALIAIELGNMEEVVTIPEGVLNSLPSDAVSSGLQAGEQISMENLLYCMMVHSANDAAMVIANHIKGSQSTFVEEMNRYAEELGCTGTHFTNVHGLHDAQQYTTARDTARILAAAMEHELFRTVFGTAEYTVPATNLSEERHLITGNYLMSKSSMGIYFDSRVTGGRTGITSSGTRCLAASAEDHGMRLISIVMGCKTTYTGDGYTVQSFGSFPETRAILDAGFSGYKTVQLLYPGQTLRQYSVEKGTSDVILGTKEGASTVLPEDADLSRLVYRYSDIQEAFRVPIEKDSKLSTVQIWYDNVCLAQTELYAMNSVKETQNAVISEPEPAAPAIWGKVLPYVAVAVLAVIVLLLIVRIAARIRRAAARKRSRKYRADRRRSR